MVDLFIIVVFILMLCLGLYRGFIKEMLGLLGLISAISLSALCNKWVVDNLLNYGNDPFLSSTLAYIVSFLFFSIIFGMIIALVVKFLKRGDTSISDRLLGAVIGGAKAYLLCLLFYFIVYGFNSTLQADLNEKDDVRKVETITPDWLKYSKTYPLFYHSVLKLDDLLKKLLDEKKEVITIDTNESHKPSTSSELRKRNDESSTEESDMHEDRNIPSPENFQNSEDANQDDLGKSKNKNESREQNNEIEESHSQSTLTASSGSSSA